MTKTYRIYWEATTYGESFIEANNIQEAYNKMRNNEDTGFNPIDTDQDWEPIQIISEDDNEKIMDLV